MKGSPSAHGSLVQLQNGFLRETRPKFDSSAVHTNCRFLDNPLIELFQENLDYINLLSNTEGMSLLGEGLQVVHSLLAPREIKQLAREFGHDEILTPSYHIRKAFDAQSAEEAAFHVRYAALTRRDMRQIVNGYVQREDLARFKRIVTSSGDKTDEGTLLTQRRIEDYTDFRRSHRAFFHPSSFSAVADRISDIFPALPLKIAQNKQF